MDGRITPRVGFDLFVLKLENLFNVVSSMSSFSIKCFDINHFQVILYYLLIFKVSLN